MSIINFGKHKGRTVEWVISNDEDYMTWACENTVTKITNYLTNDQIDHFLSIGSIGYSDGIDWCHYAEHC